jgi:hypothetical protein
MANPEHLDILKQGVEVWNQWNSKNYEIKPDLSGANLSGANLTDIILSDVNLADADLREASLVNATLVRTNFARANLIKAELDGASLHQAILWQANLRHAFLSGVLLNYTDLEDSNLSFATVDSTIFGDVDLSNVKGLKSIRHQGPSMVSTSTLVRSHGKIPEIFLRKAGVPDSFIEYSRSLITNPIEYYTCFISYSSKDQALIERLYADLQSKGVRCWFAPKDLKIGDQIRSRIDEAIRIYDKLLIVLSKSSVESDWVEKEVETAFEKERQQNKPVLFPLRLDDTVMTTNKGWAADIRRTRHIGDFKGWKNHDNYQKAFARLLHDLKAEP